MLTGRTGEATATQAEAASQKRRLPFISAGLTADVVSIPTAKLHAWFETMGEIKVNRDFRQLGCKNVSFGRCTLSIMEHFQHHDTELGAGNELLMLAMMSQRFYFSKERII